MLFLCLFVIINILHVIILLSDNTISLVNEVLGQVFTEPPSAVKFALGQKQKSQYKSSHHTDLDVEGEVVLSKHFITCIPKDMMRAVMPYPAKMPTGTQI
jgi:hypothetical protein